MKRIWFSLALLVVAPRILAMEPEKRMVLLESINSINNRLGTLEERQHHVSIAIDQVAIQYQKHRMLEAIDAIENDRRMDRVVKWDVRRSVCQAAFCLGWAGTIMVYFLKMLGKANESK